MPQKESNQNYRRSPYYPLPRDLTFPSEKKLFRKWANNRKRLVEIGVFEGASGATFRAAMASDATLHLIDPFIPDSMNSRLRARKFFAKMNLHRILNGKIIWHEDFSYNVIKTWNESIDFLFIDGDHTFEACLNDWENWSPYVAKDGIVIFHDARLGKGDGTSWDGWDGPTEVVDRLFRGIDKLKHWEIVDEAGTAVAVRRIA